MSPDQAVDLRPRLYAHAAPMTTIRMSRVGTLMASAIASPASSETKAAIHTARTLIAPAAIGLSVRPAAASRRASQASLDQPTDSWPASMAGAVSTGPMPCGAASAASRVAMAVMASDGPGWLAMISARTRFMTETPGLSARSAYLCSVRLALRGANPAEWLALLAGVVPSPAAEAWGGMGLSGILVAAVRSGVTARLAQNPATAAELAADLDLDPLPTRLLLDCLRSSGHVTVRAGRYQLSRRSRRWLDPASGLSVAEYVAGTADYWNWWAELGEVTRGPPPRRDRVARRAARRPVLGALHPRPARARQAERRGGGQEAAAAVRRAAAARHRRRPRLYSAALCRRHPGLTATVLDLPGSAAVGREIVAAAGMADRVRFRDGDATAGDLGSGDLGSGYDAVLCFNLVHHLGPDQIPALFGKAREALAPGGTLAVMDVFADPARRASARGELPRPVRLPQLGLAGAHPGAAARLAPRSRLRCPAPRPHAAHPRAVPVRGQEAVSWAVLQVPEGSAGRPLAG